MSVQQHKVLLPFFDCCQRCDQVPRSNSTYMASLDCMENKLLYRANTAFEQGDFRQAIHFWSLALKDKQARPAVILANRSAAHAHLSCWREALCDAQQVRPDCTKTRLRSPGCPSLSQVPTTYRRNCQTSQTNLSCCHSCLEHEASTANECASTDSSLAAHLCW